MGSGGEMMLTRRPPRAVLFDFDFTLGDSSRGIIDSALHALESINRPPVPPEAIRKLIGLSLPEVALALDATCSPREVDCFIAAFHRRADLVVVETTTFYPGVLSLIRSLRRSGVRTGIVSTKVRRRIEAILDAHAAPGDFNIIVGIEDVPAHKPDPAGLNLALAQLGVPSDSALYIGDHPVDAEAAIAAGIPFIGVLTGMTTREHFTALGATAIPDLSHLLDALNQLPAAD